MSSSSSPTGPSKQTSEMTTPAPPTTSTINPAPTQQPKFDYDLALSEQNTKTNKIEKLSSLIIKSTIIGGLYGALFSIPTELFIRWRSPFYRSFGTRIRVFYHTICVAYGASFYTEREVMRFEEINRIEDERKRQQLIELSVMQGLYTGEEEGYKISKK
ncbi:unnamed protein product [Ambrosiozyma monospora]|uniref:Unnamed protein product n=1 Tax=Ambrosiozyma monospora TaxID=43982 RepID=A0ACB5SW67_AMBMO|nr:unnamed protein product [Ambrosiozyma monospora]